MKATHWTTNIKLFLIELQMTGRQVYTTRIIKDLFYYNSAWIKRESA